MTETLIKKFAQISKADIEIAGGKGASLGEMIQAGIPVPEGFVILSNAFDRFLEETDLNVEIDAILDKVDIKEVHTVENASEKIQALILSRGIPEDIRTEILKFYKNIDCKFVAVRSSATSEDSASAAWAGQLDSFLNTTKDTLLENVKRCWASLFTPRAIFYRFEKKLNKDKISVAIVVQKMVDSEESGIAFSVHPVTQDEYQIIIEAGFGLGEAIVSGSITPDSYVVDKQGYKILDINVNEQTKALYKKAKGGNEWKELGKKGKKQVLSKKEIVELSKMIVKIENHYGFPCDIEWAKEKGKFYIVQSRPITTIDLIQKSFESINNNKTEKTNKHKGALREYTLLGISSVFNKIISKDFSQFFGGSSLADILIVIRDGDFYHFQVEEDVLKLGKSFLKRILDNNLNLDSLYNKFDAEVYKLEKIYNQKDLSLEIIERFFELYSNLIKVAYAAAYSLDVIEVLPENKRQECKLWIEKSRIRGEAIYKFGEMEFIPKITSYLSKNYFPKYSPENLSYLFSNELINWIKKELPLPSKKILTERKKYFYARFIPFDKMESFVGDEAKKIVSKKELFSEIDKKIEGINEFKGQIAYNGFVKGIVRIIKKREDMRKFNDGEIIVSQMTDPSYLPIMKRAIAFVTDEGGTLCHAAIVARELKKPCIIGTKIATNALKDGDEIEVNANEGTVRIIKV